MTTALKIGPVDHGRVLTWEEFANSEWEDGFQYEIIDERLYASPLPDAPQGLVEYWLFTNLLRYSLQYPDALNLVYNKARVFVPNRPRATSLEPDVAGYNDFPLGLSYDEIRWEDNNPILVAEVLSPDDPNKDLVRNVPLYLAVPTIKEYWIVDNRENPDEPTLRVHRRRGQRWQGIIEVGFGETYTTKLLPGFSLVVDPRR